MSVILGSIVNGSDWSYQDDLEELEKNVESVSTNLRKEALEKLAKYIDVPGGLNVDFHEKHAD